MSYLHRILLLAGCLLWTACAAASPYKIAVIHSYEKGYHDAGRYMQLLDKELSATGIDARYKEFFLNCDELLYDEELRRAQIFIDKVLEWDADLLVLFNNQALYSILKCAHPALRSLPIVFSNAYHPDLELLASFPNVTGHVDLPDYVGTVRMIERMMGPARIVVMSGKGMIDSQMWVEMKKQYELAGIATYEGDIEDHLLEHRSVQRYYQEHKTTTYNERIDTTVVVRLLSENMPLRIIQQTARGSHTYLMLCSRTYNTLDAQEFFANPTFGAINEGFGSNTNMLGGYFTPLEIQMSDLAQDIRIRLEGKMPERQFEQGIKRYVLNWHALKKFGIDEHSVPTEYRIMYTPFGERYGMIINVLYFLLALVVGAVIFGLQWRLTHERRRKKDALEKMLYEHETLMLALEGGGTTYAWQLNGGLLSFDTHFYRLIGHEGKYIAIEKLVQYVHPDDAARFRTNILECVNIPHRRDEYRCRFNGDYSWWEFRYSQIGSSSPHPLVTGLLQNIQEIKDREEELIRARQLAERAELKQSFLNNMSHEIRTPLNAIAGFSELLTSSPDLSDEERKVFVEIINQNKNLLLNLINDVLELSRIESGTTSFALRPHNIQALLQGYYQTYSLQVKPGIGFECDFPHEDYTVRVDPLRLQQVVTNLLSNANKFTDSGTIRLGYRHAPHNNSVLVFVEDTGRGIPVDEQEMIFSRFYKGDEFVQGTGLGLPICRSIVERMNGRIEVDSQPGRGSRFTIVLPLS